MVVEFDTSFSIETETYKSDIYHYFMAVYDGSTFSIYIDGTEASTSSMSGSVPPTIDGSQMDIFINRVMDGYAYNTTGNYGRLLNLAVFIDVTDEEELMKEIVNYGIEYATQDTNDGRYIDNFNILFNDPEVVRVNSAIDDVSFIYLARSDGKILRGSPLFWESRKVYSNSDESLVLNETVSDQSDKAVVDNGFMKIKKSIVRL